MFPAVELCPACSRLLINPRPTAQAATEKAFSFHDLASPNSRPGTAPPRCQEEEVLRALRGKDGLARCPVGCNMTFKRGDVLLSHLARDHSNILDRVCAGCLSDFDPTNRTKCHVCTIIRTDPVLAPPQSVDINAPTSTRFPERVVPRRFSLAYHCLGTQGGPRVLKAKDKRRWDGDSSAVRRGRCRSLDLTLNLDAGFLGSCRLCFKEFFSAFDPPETRSVVNVWRALRHSMQCRGYEQSFDRGDDDWAADTWR